MVVSSARSMSVHVDTRWDRSLVGRNPSRVLIAGSNIACSYIEDQGGGGTPGPRKLVCFDLEGNQRWTAGDFDLQAALVDGTLIGISEAGALRFVDGDGCEQTRVREVAIEGARRVTASGDRFVVTTNVEAIVVDAAFNDLVRIPVNEDRGGVVVDDAVLYLDGDQIVRVDQRGRVESLCPIPIAMAHDAMLRWERETGTPALHGVATLNIDPSADFGAELAAAVTDSSRQTPFSMGQRLSRFNWSLNYVESTNALFITNGTFPHLIICVGLDGVARWARYLSSGCCGGGPVALPNGELVTSSGCGGIVSWLNDQGDVKRQTVPHDGVGLATAHSGRVRTLADSSCIVDGGMGIEAFDAKGDLVWRSDDDCSCFDYDETLGLLVAAWWNDAATKTVTIRCARTIDSRHARA